jgi:hypothetical protein
MRTLMWLQRRGWTGILGGDTMRQPVDVNNSEARDATLYRAAISIGVQETQLIWSRYTGFIIMNGFLVSVLTNEMIRGRGELLVIIGVITLVLNSVWHTLNYSGWHNQNLFYCQAANLFTSDVGLVTDHFRTRNCLPFGWIYWLAQTIPTMFSLLAIPCFADTINSRLLVPVATSWLIGIVPWVASAVGVLLIEYKLIAAQAREGFLEPV